MSLGSLGEVFSASPAELAEIELGRRPLEIVIGYDGAVAEWV